MSKFKSTRIQDRTEFGQDGHKIVFKEYFPETDTYVYCRYSGGYLSTYEVVRPKYIMQDGERIGVFPSSSDWGHLGMTVIAGTRYARKEIDFLVSTKDWSSENLFKFRKSLKVN